MRTSCIVCKGNDPVNSCGRTFCPIYAKAQAIFKVREKIVNKDFFGSSPAPFVGRFGYPFVNVGILSPNENHNSWVYDSPQFWSSKNYSIPKIVDLRSALINSRFKVNIKASNRLLKISQEVGMASKPVDVEINLKEKPKFGINYKAELAPMGPIARLKKARITENPRIHKKVDKVVSDTDLKANHALIYLYKNGFDENFLSKLLSVGTIGLKNNRKLVPTRWSITATDDAIAKNLTSEIKNYNEINYSAYFGSYLGNYYLILFFPEKWSYELFEGYLPRASWNISSHIQYTTDYESYNGRKSYAENCGGGYYAARLPVLEKLKNLKRQGSVLCLRFITGEYAVPLGVWVCREAVRKSLNNEPIEFSSNELMLKYAQALIKKKFNYDLDDILKKSILLKDIKEQSKLIEFF